MEKQTDHFTGKRTVCGILLLLGCLLMPQVRGQELLPVVRLSDINQLVPQQPDSFFLQLKTQLQQYRKQGNQPEEAITLQQLGQLLYHHGNYSEAVEQLLEADKLLRHLKQTALLAANLNILGKVYTYNRQSDEAFGQYREALTIYQRLRQSAGVAATYGLIGHLYEKKPDHDSAYYYQQLALHYARQAMDTAVLSKIYENIGSIYEDRERYDSARYYFLLALKGYRETGNRLDQIEVINNLGDVWSKTGYFSKGMEYARAAASMALATGEKYQLQSAYRDISENFAGMGQFDSAYIYLEKSRELVQTIYKLENSHQISLMQTLHGMEKQQVEISRLNAERKLNWLLLVAISAGLVLLGLLGALVISRQKMKIRNERAVNEGNRKVYETQTALMEVELKRQQAEEASLKQQLDLKSRELSSHILHLIQKNEVMEELKQGLTVISKDDKRDQKKQVRQLLQKINFSFSQDTYWEEFRLIFDKVHPAFMDNLQQVCPGLTPGETRLLALVRMNLNSADMATLLGVTGDSLRVLRYRVRKKLDLPQGESLTAFVQTI
ncbi:MAG: tetratricopeptide repeat protein [Candidatus Pseudobacter hemicellulosilyticus]|uniref:Tetratricopeptide repeat protein n=1 Tax=Candidatus Pseudobacter hemicellulosilyticus TaxID=3121375 RepID=A0AAJ5WRY9_9BACT|nr:MAG: tetratricopeptide repeat protein [Pseudobacter sp.]